MLEKTRFTSYSACGIPFLVGGLVAGGVEALVARSPEAHRERGIDVRTNHQATAIDIAKGEVEVLDEHAGTTQVVGYDELLIATGGEPVRPDLPGIDLPLVHGVQSLADAQVLLSLADEGCRRIVIVGGGYIGLEMAEAYIERGCTATVIERGPQPLGVVDEDFGVPRRRRPARPRHRRVDRHRGDGVRAGRRRDAGRRRARRPRHPRARRGAPQPARPRRRHRARREGRRPGRPAPGHERRPRVGRRRLRRVHPPRQRRARAHRPRHVRQPPRPGGRHQHGRRRRPLAAGAGHGRHQAVHARGRPHRAAARRGQGGPVRRRRHHRRHDHRRRLPPPRHRHDGAPRRRAGHRAAARRPDHRRPRLGQAHRHRRHGDHRRDDRGRRDGPRPRLRPAVLVGVGPDRRRRPRGA